MSGSYTDIPMLYARENDLVSRYSPSSVHCRNTELSAYYRRYLFQKFCSVFEWNLPEHWDKDFFMYTLYAEGYLAVFDSGKYGIIPMNCTLSGYNIFYRPSSVLIANPLLKGHEKLTIGKGCQIIKLMPDYGSILDLISYYADMMALSSESASMNLVNSKLAYVFAAKNKASAEAFKKLYDRVASGEPAVVLDKSLYNDDGSVNWETFAQNLSSNYIAGDILEDMNKWEDKFNTDIGIPNANTSKRERMIVDEVNANNVDTTSKVQIWLETMRDCVKKVNDAYGLNITVKLRYDKEVEYASDNDDSGSLSI